MGNRVFALFIFAIALVVFINTLDMADSNTDPLGPAALPKLIAALICLLSIPLILAPQKGKLGGGESNQNKAQDGHPRVAAMTIILVVLYVGIMSLNLAGFAAATVGFLIASMTLLVRYDPATVGSTQLRRWIVTIVLALLMSLGLQFIFTKILVVNLP